MTVEDRIFSGEPFTYSALCALRPNNDADRYADKTIQKYRRKGYIAFTREGRAVVWRLTDAGQEYARARAHKEM
jgi:hypothetical protein